MYTLLHKQNQQKKSKNYLQISQKISNFMLFKI
jgi:hypothetical protein